MNDCKPADGPGPVTDAAFGFWSSRAFRGPKTPEPVHAETRLHEDFLTIASLDEEVRSIAPPPEDGAGFGTDARPDFVITRADGTTQLVRVIPHDADPETRATLLGLAEAAGEKGIQYRVYDEAWVGREPRLRNARLIHGCRRTRVTPGDRVRILNFLNENGQSTLMEAAAAVTGSPDGVECVLALVAEGNVMVDLDVTMAPEMPVWRLKADWDADR